MAALLLRKLGHEPRTGIVARFFVFATGVAQPDDQLNRAHSQHPPLTKTPRYRVKR
jgi:hypothetical protein